MKPNPPFTPLPPHSSCHHWRREGDCVKIIDDLEHMCASLWRPTHNLSSDPLSIHLSFALVLFTPSLLSSPLLLYNRLPSPHFLLSKFISLQVPSPFFFPPPHPHLIPRCLSLPRLPTNALRLATLFPFKIKIIKSAAK